MLLALLTLAARPGEYDIARPFQSSLVQPGQPAPDWEAVAAGLRSRADDVQARLKKQVDSARAAKRQALLSAVEEEGDAAVREARRKEEERLSEDARVADILAENARLVAAAQKRASTK